MKTNARKILSLFLSFLMVFGSVATLLPTTVMAAETDTTDAKYIKVYTAADFSAAIDDGRLGFKNGSTAYGSFSYSITDDGYLRATPTAKTANVIPFALAEPLDVSTAKVVVVAFRTNTPASNSDFFLTFPSDNGFGSGEKTHWKKPNDMDDCEIDDNEVLTATIKVSSADSKNVCGPESISFIKINPWNGKDIPGLSETFTYSDAYADIRYIAFFESEADYQAFDFERDIQKTVTVKDENEKVIGEFSGSIGTKTDVAEVVNLPYVNKDGAFLTLVDESGKLYSYSEASDFVIIDDVTLTATYQNVHAFFSTEDLVNANYDSFYYNGNSNYPYFDPVKLTQIGGVDYALFTANYSGSNHFVLWFDETPVTQDTVGLVEFVTNKKADSSYVAFLQYVTSPTDYGVRTGSHKISKDLYTATNISTDNTVYYAKGIFEFSKMSGSQNAEKVYAYRFAPWAGVGNMTSDYYSAIRYFATFDNADIASVFDYDAYMFSLENDFYVTLNRETNAEYSVTPVSKGETFTFPGYVAPEGYIFAGWKAADGTVYSEGDKITVNESLTFTALASEGVTVTLLAEDGETQLSSKVYVKGEVLELSDVAGIPYKDENGKFLVWTDGTDIYGDTFTVSESVTLTAQRKEAYGFYSALDLLAVSWMDRGGFETTKDLIKNNGKYYTGYDVKSGNGHRFALCYSETGFPVTEDSVTVVDFITSVKINADGSNGARASMQFMKSYNDDPATFYADANRKAKYQLTADSYTTLVDGLYYVKGYFPLGEAFKASGAEVLDTVYGYRFLPFNGTWGVPAGATLAIQYIATFESSAVADAFDYSKYMSDVLDEKYTVKFLDKTGSLISQNEYDFYDELIIPSAPVLEDHTFDGWYDVAAGKVITSLDGVYVTSDNTYVARYTRETLVYTAEDIEDRFKNIQGNLEYELITEANGSTYVRITPKQASVDEGANSSGSDRFVVNTPDNIVYGNPYVPGTKSDFTYFVIGHRTNIDIGSTSLSTIYYATDGSYQNSAYNDNYWQNGTGRTNTGADGKAVVTLNAMKIVTGGTDKAGPDKVPKLSYIQIRPYNAVNIAYTADQYFDIEYIAFFPTKAEADAFDYEAYLESQKEYTIELTATVGGKVSYNGGEPGEKFTITAKKGTILTFTATPDSDSRLRGWHDLTSGQIVDLGSTELVYEYTVEKNALINANFVPNALRPNVRFIAFIGRGAEGYFTVSGKEGEFVYFDDYVSLGDDVTLTAYANTGYIPAGWVRITQDTDVEVLAGIGTEITVPAAGANVFYQPVFFENDAEANIYVDKATNEILSTEGQPDGYTYDAEKDVVTNGNINVIYCTKGKTQVQFTVYGLASDNETLKEVQSELTLNYADSYVIKTQRDDTKWTMKVNGGTAFDVSYDKEFNFTYMFPAGTTVEIIEALEEAQVADVKTLASVVDGDKTTFTGVFVLPDNYKLVSHGILMSQTVSDLEAATAENGEIKVAESVIVGHIRDNSENATAIYTVSKKHVTGTNNWFGRAFLVYEDADGAVQYAFGATIPVPAE